MPAAKPMGLQTRHNTKAEIQAAKDREAALTPDRELSEREPNRLDGDKVAAATWRRIMREYNRLEAKLVSRLDMDLLIDYCLVMSQIDSLDKMREAARKFWETLDEGFANLHSSGDLVGSWTMANKVSKAYENVLKLDARVDQKRKLVFQYRQSLFMTPRSRSGVKPEEDQEKKAPIDPMEELLNSSLEKARNKVDSNGGSGDEA